MVDNPTFVSPEPSPLNAVAVTTPEKTAFSWVSVPTLSDPAVIIPVVLKFPPPVTSSDPETVALPPTLKSPATSTPVAVTLSASVLLI